jgi:hypothetical protein
MLALANVALAFSILSHRPPSPVSEKRFAIVTKAGHGDLRYASNGSLEGSEAPLAIVLLHGTGSGAGALGMVPIGEALAKAAGHPDALVIAPQFFLNKDAIDNRLPDSTLRWDDSAWITDDIAAEPAPRIHAYAAIHAVIDRLADRDRFPALRAIVLAGFSGGAQLVQRFAVVMADPARAGAPPVRYVVADPYSYLYFDDRRPSHGSFAPYHGKCSNFNDWHMGFADVGSAYGPVPALVRRYPRRRVVYLIGDRDNLPDPDTPCAAALEGNDRLDRARKYAAYITEYFPSGTRSTFAVVPGAGHDGGAVLDSACAAEAIFDRPRTACRT